jgi:hypothetical protein
MNSAQFGRIVVTSRVAAEQRHKLDNDLVVGCGAMSHRHAGGPAPLTRALSALWHGKETARAESDAATVALFEGVRSGHTGGNLELVIR